MTFHVLGFVLKIDDFRENDKIASIYTDRLGKVDMLIRGGKRMKSKLAGKCQPFALLNLVVSPGRFWWHLIGLESAKIFRKIWQDKVKLEVGTKIISAVDVYVKKEKKDINIFKLLLSALMVLDIVSSPRAVLILNSFLIKLISLLGYQPNLKSCVFCQRKYKDGLVFFHFAKGGIVCRQCQKRFRGAEAVSGETIIFLFQMLNKRFLFWSQAPLPREKNIKEAERIINQFILWHLA